MSVDPLFTERDIQIAERCIGHPETYGLTEPERRACLAVIAYCRNGTPIGHEYAILARTLFDAVARMDGPDAS